MPDTAEVTPLSTVHDDAWSAPPQDDKLRIFISHKLADGQVAKVVKDSLRLIGGPRTEISVSEDIGFGDDWVEQIHHQLSMSDWLFLLYTDPSMGWDWCLYETGFFRGKTDKKDRLIVIHNPNTDIPNVLTRWKSVPATPPAINELVQQVFSEEPRTHVPPIRDDLGGLDELLRPTIERIVGELGDSTKTYWYTNYLSILLSPQQLDAFVAGNQIPDDAHVDGDAGSLALFGLTKSKNHDYSWKHLLEELDSPEQKAWIEDLAPQLRRALDDRKIQPALSYFKASRQNGAGTYRPMIHRLKKKFNGFCDIHVLFLKLPVEFAAHFTEKIFYPYVRIRISHETAVIERASSGASELFGAAALAGKDLAEMVEALSRRMPPQQREAFLAEQEALVARLFLNKHPRASVPIVLTDRPGSAYLPVVTRYVRSELGVDLDVVYFDIGRAAAADESGVVRWQLAPMVTASEHDREIEIAD